MENSKKYKLNAIDGKKIFTGLGIALLGAFITYMQDLIPSIDFGVYTPIAMAINSVIVNLLRKLLTGLK